MPSVAATTAARDVSVCVDDPQVAKNRVAWEEASEKYVREHDELLRAARAHTSLLEEERRVLAPILRESPEVLHLLSGNGLDDIDLAAAGARRVLGVDFSHVATSAAQRRAREVNAPVRYVVAQVPHVPVRCASVDLVYLGKGALPWLPDLTAWANEVERLLRTGGHLFLYEAHPAVPLWTWDPDEPRVRSDRSYFAASHVNDTFPGRGAVEWQRSLGEILTAVISAGLRICHVGEYAEPFWRPGGLAEAAAWTGRLPNAFSLLAVKP